MIFLFFYGMLSFAGEDYGGVAKLYFRFHILTPDGKKGCFEEISNIKNNNFYSLIKASSKEFSAYGTPVSFIKKERWLKVPFRKKFFEYYAEKDCLLIWDFETASLSENKSHWIELKMFVENKLVPASVFKFKYGQDEYFDSFSSKSRKKERKHKKMLAQKMKQVEKHFKKAPRATQGGVIINSQRSAVYSKVLKKGETFKFFCEVRAIAEENK